MLGNSTQYATNSAAVLSVGELGVDLDKRKRKRDFSFKKLSVQGVYSEEILKLHETYIVIYNPISRDL